MEKVKGPVIDNSVKGIAISGLSLLFSIAEIAQPDKGG